MTKNKVDKLLTEADLFYRVFPTERETVNHKIIKKVVPIIQRIMEYRGATKGYNALPKDLLVMRYEEMYSTLQELREKLNREEPVYREALRSLSDAEELLDYIFI